MTDTRTHIAKLIEATIAGEDTSGLAHAITQSKTVELLQRNAMNENSKGPTGFNVETYGGDRYTSVAWWPTEAEADAHCAKIKASGRWAGMPPRVVPGSSSDHVQESVGDPLQQLEAHFQAKSGMSADEFANEFAGLVDNGDVPAIIMSEYAASEYVEYDGGSDRSPEIAFGEDTAFIRFLNSIVAGSGDALIALWDEDAGYTPGEPLE